LAFCAMKLHPVLKKNLKIAGIALYAVLLVIIGLELFSGGQISLFGNSVNRLNKTQDNNLTKETLNIGYAFKPQSLEPTLFDPYTRSFLLDIYEGLVSTDRSLNIKPAIAVSWGLVDENTWEFRLRPGIKFHNSQPVTADDVIASIERAQTYKDSQLKTLLNNIKSVVSVGEDRIRIITKAPDPLLLNKLAVTFIFPSNMSDFQRPVGTGPYRFEAMEEYRMIIRRNIDYYGDQPVYRVVNLMVIPNKSDRLAALEKGEIQLLTALPPSVACSRTEKYANAEGCVPIKNPDIRIKTIPSLEVSFLVYNHENELLSLTEIRSVLREVFDPQVFVDLAFGFAKPSDQYVSGGVFGFNAEIAKLEYDMDSAKKEIEKISKRDTFKQIVLTFDYPKTAQAIGEYVKAQLEEIGIVVELNPVSDEELLNKISGGTSDLYYLGFRSELGDSMDFMQALGHSKDIENGYGLYNGSNYVNKKVDQLIENAQRELDTVKRLKGLQEAMKIITEDDIYGIPLFEAETIFAFTKDLNFEPRVDGYIHASEIK
jgi:peptide/nickel transport system substrate-binding protein